jgi:hypothetical protein
MHLGTLKPYISKFIGHHGNFLILEENTVKLISFGNQIASVHNSDFRLCYVPFNNVIFAS